MVLGRIRVWDGEFFGNFGPMRIWDRSNFFSGPMMTDLRFVRFWGSRTSPVSRKQHILRDVI